MQPVGREQVMEQLNRDRALSDRRRHALAEPCRTSPAAKTHLGTQPADHTAATCRPVSTSPGPLVAPDGSGAAIPSFAGLGSVNVEHGLAADAAVQQGVDRRLRLAP